MQVNFDRIIERGDLVIKGGDDKDIKKFHSHLQKLNPTRYY